MIRPWCSFKWHLLRKVCGYNQKSKRIRRMEPPIRFCDKSPYDRQARRQSQCRLIQPRARRSPGLRRIMRALPSKKARQYEWTDPEYWQEDERLVREKLLQSNPKRIRIFAILEDRHDSAGGRAKKSKGHQNEARRRKVFRLTCARSHQAQKQSQPPQRAAPNRLNWRQACIR
jgi:hypothetical protein